MAGLKGEAGESPALPRNGNQPMPNTQYVVSGIGWKPGRPPLLALHPLAGGEGARHDVYAVLKFVWLTHASIRLLCVCQLPDFRNDFHPACEPVFFIGS